MLLMKWSMVVFLLIGGVQFLLVQNGCLVKLVGGCFVELMWALRRLLMVDSS